MQRIISKTKIINSKHKEISRLIALENNEIFILWSDNYYEIFDFFKDDFIYTGQLPFEAILKYPKKKDIQFYSDYKFAYFDIKRLTLNLINIKEKDVNIIIFFLMLTI